MQHECSQKRSRWTAHSCRHVIKIMQHSIHRAWLVPPTCISLFSLANSTFFRSRKYRAWSTRGDPGDKRNQPKPFPFGVDSSSSPHLPNKDSSDSSRGGQQDIVFVAGRIPSGFSTAHTKTFPSERLRTRQDRGRSPLRPLARSPGSFVGCNARAPPPGETVFRPSPVQLAGTVSHLCPW